MSLFIWPPVSLSISNVAVANPDGTQAEFNPDQTQDGTLTNLSGLTTTPVVINTLTADVKKIIVKNDSGNNIFLRFGTRSKILIQKGSVNEQYDAKGLIGEQVTVEMVSGVGTAGDFGLNYLG